MESGGVGAAAGLLALMEPCDGGVVGTIGNGEGDGGIAANGLWRTGSHNRRRHWAEGGLRFDNVPDIADPIIAAHGTRLGRGDEVGGHFALVVVGAADNAGKSGWGIEVKLPLIVAGREEGEAVAPELESLGTWIATGNHDYGVGGSVGVKTFQGGTIAGAERRLGEHGLHLERGRGAAPYHGGGAAIGIQHIAVGGIGETPDVAERGVVVLHSILIALPPADIVLAHDGRGSVGLGEDMDSDRVGGAEVAACGGDDIGAREGEGNGERTARGGLGAAVGEFDGPIAADGSGTGHAAEGGRTALAGWLTDGEGGGNGGWRKDVDGK